MLIPIYTYKMPRYAGSDYNETRTPLYYAAVGGHIDAMKLLFELGADPMKYDANKDEDGYEADTVLRSIVRKRYKYESHAFYTYGDEVADLLAAYRDENGESWFSLNDSHSDWECSDSDSDAIIYIIEIGDPRPDYDDDGSWG